jgi:hypothetical protein
VIVEFFINSGAMIAEFFAGIFAAVALPSFVVDAMPMMQGFLQSASGLAIWIPWAMISLTVGSLVTFYLVMFGTRLVQKIWGLVPVVGGSG